MLLRFNYIPMAMQFLSGRHKTHLEKYPSPVLAQCTAFKSLSQPSLARCLPTGDRCSTCPHRHLFNVVCYHNYVPATLQCRWNKLRTVPNLWLKCFVSINRRGRIQHRRNSALHPCVSPSHNRGRATARRCTSRCFVCPHYVYGMHAFLASYVLLPRNSSSTCHCSPLSASRSNGINNGCKQGISKISSSPHK